MDCSYLPAGVIKSNRGYRKPRHNFKQSALAEADPEKQGYEGGEHPSRTHSHQTSTQGIHFEIINWICLYSEGYPNDASR